MSCYELRVANCWIAHYARKFNKLPKTYTDENVINIIQNKVNLVVTSSRNGFSFPIKGREQHFDN